MIFSFLIVLAGMLFAYTLIHIWETSKWVVLVLGELLLIWWLFVFSQKQNIKEK
jgi:Flp pilus assembly protein TadB